MPRISVNILLLISTFALPWWVSLLFLVSSIFYFSWYYEAVVIVLFYELLFGLAGSVMWLSLATLLFIPFAEWLKKRLYVFH